MKTVVTLLIHVKCFFLKKGFAFIYRLLTLTETKHRQHIHTSFWLLERSLQNYSVYLNKTILLSYLFNSEGLSRKSIIM